MRASIARCCPHLRSSEHRHPAPQRSKLNTPALHWQYPRRWSAQGEPPDGRQTPLKSGAREKTATEDKR
eukprot:828269-Alexandrium_andersonii.AAC.1